MTADYQLPEVLAAPMARQLERLEAVFADLGYQLDPEARYVFALSEFAGSAAVRDADWFVGRMAQRWFQRAMDMDDIQAELQPSLASLTDMDGLQQLLRRARNRLQLWIVWRHLTRRAPLEETTASLSLMADALIQAALDRVHQWRCFTRIRGRWRISWS